MGGFPQLRRRRHLSGAHYAAPRLAAPAGALAGAGDPHQQRAAPAAHRRRAARDQLGAAAALRHRRGPVGGSPLRRRRPPRRSPGRAGPSRPPRRRGLGGGLAPGRSPAGRGGGPTAIPGGCSPHTGGRLPRSSPGDRGRSRPAHSAAGCEWDGGASPPPALPFRGRGAGQPPVPRHPPPHPTAERIDRERLLVVSKPEPPALRGGVLVDLRSFLFRGDFRMRLLKLVRGLAGLAAFTFVLPAFAQANPPQSQVPTVTQTIEVTATRTPEDVETVPASVTVISGDDLAARGARDLPSALAL